MKAYFTITAGRTGTAWLSDFLTLNLQTKALHEAIGIDDIGTRTPDIRTMRNFNHFGNNELVKSFWAQKLGGLTGEIYAETNHTLSKCGLIENISSTPLAMNTTIICLRRDLVKQCVSYMTRYDFYNYTTMWQWYLDPRCRLKIVNPAPFSRFGTLGSALWYSFEMLARQEYYVQKYAKNLRFVDASLEEITSRDGAEKFLSALGVQKFLGLPAPRNESTSAAPKELVDVVSRAVKSFDADISSLVKHAISEGFTFEPTPNS